jgi:peptidoglycan/LPS O-acetylase OafA/YrhL
VPARRRGVGRRAGLTGRRAGFRTDIQGLRAIAIVLIVVHHLWPGGLTGGYVGVDVFFVITGFLITAMLLDRQPRRPRDFAEFWARRIRRVLPAALLVIAVTGIVTRWVAPSPTWITTARQVLASTVFAENWVLAAGDVNVPAVHSGSSPLHQFWSLSVAAQLYLLWPLLIAAALWWAARRAGAPRAAVLAVTGAMVAASLGVSVWWTSAVPAVAYVVTPTRMWELALGGLVAALPARATTSLPPAVRSGLPWLGIAGIVGAAVWFTSDTAFPGYAALLPTVGTALVLWCRPVASWSPDRVLALRPVQYLGGISYSLYLWHWPIIALLPFVSGPLGTLDKIVALIAAIVLADLTRSAVEEPFRRARTPRAVRNTYRFGGVAVLAVALVATLWLSSTTAQVYGAEQPISPAEANAGPCFGAASMARGFTRCPQDPAVAPIPSPKNAGDDKPVAYQDNCWSYAPFLARPVCTFGDGPTRVALVGNTAYWLPTLMKLTQQRNWTITTYLTSRCAPSDTRQRFKPANVTQNCYDYGQWVLDQTAHGQYDLIIATNREAVLAVGQQTWVGTETVARQGFRSYLQSWAEGGTPIVVLHDLPYPSPTTGPIPDCLAAHPKHPDRCNGTPESWRWHYPFSAAADGVAGVHVVDMTRYFCTATVCPAVIGGVTVYFDGTHMSATYARTLSPYLADELDKLHLG